MEKEEKKKDTQEKPLDALEELFTTIDRIYEKLRGKPLSEPLSDSTS